MFGMNYLFCAMKTQITVYILDSGSWKLLKIVHHVRLLRLELSSSSYLWMKLVMFCKRTCAPIITHIHFTAVMCPYDYALMAPRCEGAFTFCCRAMAHPLAMAPPLFVFSSHCHCQLVLLCFSSSLLVAWYLWSNKGHNID